MKAPFPYFGGKSRIAHEVWARFGNAPNYIEPFFGSGAVLLARPHAPKVETVNDKDCFLANFWRALQADPAGVAKWADWPVNEADLHARHWWLVRNIEFRKRMHDDPDFYDIKVAGWWVWGICQWIGSGWCEMPEWQRLPHLGDAGMGIHKPSQQLPYLGGAGMGIHKPSQQLPYLGGAGRGINSGSFDAYELFTELSERLRRVRVCCGEWYRITGPSVTDKLGITGVFLDPPYSDKAGRDGGIYAVEDLSVAHDVREWALANGDNPNLRIALCGYEGEHDIPDAWECLEWKTPGGYSSQNRNGNNNPHRERIWFSPHCLKVDRVKQMTFELMD